MAVSRKATRNDLVEGSSRRLASSHLGIVLAWHLCGPVSANFPEDLFLDNVRLADYPPRIAASAG
jgi:hypothetical protein